MASSKKDRASMREGPLAALFRKTDEAMEHAEAPIPGGDARPVAPAAPPAAAAPPAGVSTRIRRSAPRNLRPSRS